jgi:DNA-binding CsgD family transcriptional regulator
MPDVLIYDLISVTYKYKKFMFEKKIALVLGLIATLLAIDICSDLNEGASLFHIISELLAFFLAITPSFYILNMIFQKSGQVQVQLKTDLEALRQEKEVWRLQAESYLKGLSDVIDKQFQKWGFSAAEKDIALLILKGLSHKEIATLRGTAEKTVRQQAAAIYAKAGLDGKLGLSAFFLEDLMVPVR